MSAPRVFPRPLNSLGVVGGGRGFGGYEGWDPQERTGSIARSSEPQRPVILSAAKDLLRSPLHNESARRANRVPVLPPTSPERDDPAEPDHKFSAICFAPHQFSKLMEGKRGMTSLALPGADEARRGSRSGRISRAWARQRREDFFGHRKRGFNQVPRNLIRRLAPHQFSKLMEGKRGFGGFEGWDPQELRGGRARRVGGGVGPPRA